MRNLILSLFVVITSCTLFASCTKDNYTVIQKTMTALVNGKQWQTTDVLVAKRNTTTTELQITGTLPSGENIMLGLFDYLGQTGHYTVDNISTYASFGLTSDKPAYAVRGDIVVTKISDGYIYGTFDFVTEDSTYVTGGQFTGELPPGK